MGDNKGETTKKQQSPQSQQQKPSTSPKDSLEESPQELRIPSVGVTGPPPFIPSSTLYVPVGATTSSPSAFDQQFETVNNPKRPRYTTTAQWKLLLPSPSPSVGATESTPSPTINPTPQITQQQPHTTAATAASSSDTASSPLHSPIPSLSGGQETSKPEGAEPHHQLRKGKYVSPVWKPNEMLWLAKAWRIQYQSGVDGSDLPSRIDTQEATATQITRGKTRADKDREVADFLNRHGVIRDAKTAGTKWDNMLGEFRKVYEWERGGEREHVGKSYFRLSPYERKLHRLPASFDEEVFEELSQFMGPRMRNPTPQSRGLIPAGDDTSRSTTSLAVVRALPPPPLPPPFKEDDFSLSGINALTNND